MKKGCISKSSLLIDTISHGGTTIKLKLPIECNVDFNSEENLFYISYWDLEINVWGESRGAVEKAFNFVFIQLYYNSITLDTSGLICRLTEKKYKVFEIRKKIPLLIKTVNYLHQ